MKMSSLVLPLILFTGIMVGMQGFGSELLAANDVEAEGFETVEEQHKEMNNKWSEEGGDQSTFREEPGLIESATGAILIPRIASDIAGVGQNLNSIISEVSEYRWVPDWTATMIRSIVGASVFFALVGGYLRFRS